MSYRSALTNGILFTGLKDFCQITGTLIIARVITQEEFGFAVLAQSGIIVLGIINGNSVINVASQYRNPDNVNWKELLVIAQRINFYLIALLVISTIVVLSADYDPRLIGIFFLTIVTLLIEPYGSVALKYYEVTHQFRIFRTVALLGTILSVILGVICAYSGYAVYVLAIQSLAFTLPSVFFYIKTKQYFTFYFNVNDANVSTYDFYKNRFLVNFSEKIYHFLEAMFLKLILGTAGLGDVMRQKGFVNLTTDKPSNLILISLLPLVTRNKEGSGEMKQICNLIFVFAVFGIILSALILDKYGTEFYHLLYGKQWPEPELIKILFTLAASHVFLRYYAFVFQVNNFLTLNSRLILFAYLGNILILLIFLFGVELEIGNTLLIVSIFNFTTISTFGLITIGLNVNNIFQFPTLVLVAFGLYFWST